jgi:hypothetical protein
LYLSSVKTNSHNSEWNFVFLKSSYNQADEPDGKNYSVFRKGPANLKGIWPAGYPQTLDHQEHQFQKTQKMNFFTKLWKDFRGLIGTFREIFREHPLQGVILAISLLAGIGVFVFGEYQKMVQKQVREKNLTYVKQLSSLDNVEDSMRELLRFVEAQREHLRNQQKIVEDLEKERSKLAPLVEADRNIIEALFQLQAERQQSKVWVDRAIGFFLGISGSLIATALWAFIRRYRSNQADAPDRKNLRGLS